MMPNTLLEFSQKFNIVLASGSPRRVKLLSEFGVQFTQSIPNINETILSNETAHQYVLRMAVQKGASLSNKLLSNELAISCDTIVILDSQILGKPKDADDAFDILSRLSDKTHEVVTSIAISDKNNLLVKDIESTTVSFNNVSKKQIIEYVNTKEPMDKAGAYGIQGMGAFLVDRIDGNLDNVIGLPKNLLTKLAKQLLTKEYKNNNR